MRFHVTEAGPPDGRPVLALHGWPQHHWEYRDLLADPPPGLRIIAPDLPGYGWSGPAPHQWAKEDVAADVLALLDALGLDRVLLVGHDWGGYVGYLMVLRAPERFDGYLVMNMAHPWLSAATVRRIYGGSGTSVPLATFGDSGAAAHAVHRAGDLRRRGSHCRSRGGTRVRRPVPRPGVCARRAGTPTARSCFAKYPRGQGVPRRDERPCRSARVRHRRRRGSLVAGRRPRPPTPTTTHWKRWTPAHFVVDERPDLVRAKLIALAEETAQS